MKNKIINKAIVTTNVAFTILMIYFAFKHNICFTVASGFLMISTDIDLLTMENKVKVVFPSTRLEQMQDIAEG